MFGTGAVAQPLCQYGTQFQQEYQLARNGEGEVETDHQRIGEQIDQKENEEFPFPAQAPAQGK